MFKKLTFSFLLIILVLTVLLTFSFAHYSDSLLSQDLLDAYRTSAESITNQCNSQVIQIQDTLLDYAVSDALQEALQSFSPGSSPDFSVLNQPGRSLQAHAFPLQRGIIYAAGETGFYVHDPAVSEADWIQNTISKNGSLNLAAIEINGTRYIRFSMLVTDMRDWKTPIGIIATDIPLDTFVVFIGKNTLKTPDYLILVDAAGTIQYPYQVDELVSNETLREAIRQGSFTEYSQIFLSSPIKRSSWHLVISCSTSGIQNRTTQLYKTVALIALIAALFTCVVALLPSYQHSAPIVNLAKHIKSSSYLQPIEIPQKLNRDYQSLYSNYNEMVEQIDTLLSELYETNKRNRETQLKMLQAQLNPHFIYNVLDSISWLAARYQAKDIQMMVVSLATMLRCSLNSGRDILQVHQEVRQIQSYLTIQTYRYDNVIHVSYDFSPEIMNKRMIKLLLQPLVENALVHGLETFPGEKHLKVSGHIRQDMLVFEVANNGNPPDLDRIGQILSGSQQVTTSYGIRSVNERIKTVYGSQYGLRYEIRGQWTVANITIPNEPVYEERT